MDGGPSLAKVNKPLGSLSMTSVTTLRVEVPGVEGTTVEGTTEDARICVGVAGVVRKTEDAGAEVVVSTILETAGTAPTIDRAPGARAQEAHVRSATTPTLHSRVLSRTGLFSDTEGSTP